MRSEPVSELGWTEAEAMRLVRGLSGTPRAEDRLAGSGFSQDVMDTSLAQRRRDVLARTMHQEVIPRLLQARRAAGDAGAPVLPPGEAQVRELTTLVLNGSPAEALAYVEALREGGTSVETLLLHLLAPVARRLGAMWEDDTCTFSDVTLGMLRLGHVMRVLGRVFSGDVTPQAGAPSVLLAQMEGEQHGFGLAMVAQFFRRAGWRVRHEPVLSSADMAELVGAQWFGVVGISVSGTDRLDRLAAAIRAVRRCARNRAVGVMVGGLPFVLQPQLAALVGADATALDGPQAVRAARDLVGLLAAHP